MTSVVVALLYMSLMIVQVPKNRPIFGQKQNFSRKNHHQPQRKHF